MSGAALKKILSPMRTIEKGVVPLVFNFSGRVTAAAGAVDNLNFASNTITVNEGATAGNGYTITVAGVTGMATALMACEVTVLRPTGGLVVGQVENVSATAALTLVFYSVGSAGTTAAYQLAPTEYAYCTLWLKNSSV